MAVWADWEQWLAEWHASRYMCSHEGEAMFLTSPSPGKMEGLDEYRGYSRKQVNAIEPRRVL